ncbi:MAG: triose-phosphate isomerase [Candidatus Nomurabacteria bacterium]|nr:triose-phosphate isomerase [Candidatus Nomurabacteria bacterium]
MNKKIIIGNWKMNPTSLKEAVKLAKASDKNGAVLCVPFLFLNEVKKVLKKAKLGAQDVFTEVSGTYTGEVSAEMLYSIGARYVIIGHSERRAIGETNQLINKKIKSALSAGLSPIICVGEKERDESHGYLNIVKSQIEECLFGISKNSASKIIIAYEPVWALSTTANRHDATSADSQEMAIFIKKILADIFSPQIAHEMKIIYGGSVNERDAEDFLKNGGVDGVLPGRASLDPKKFQQILKIAENI